MKKFLLALFVLFAGATSVKAQYCAASATNTSTLFEKIGNVTFNTINNSSTSFAGYEDFTGVSTSVNTGATYNLSVTVFQPDNNDQIKVWIDYNNNQVFDEPGIELVWTSPNTTSGQTTYSTTVTIPSGAPGGTTRMRVRLHWLTAGAQPLPCGTSTYGQVEDYTVVVNAAPCTGTPNPGNTIATPAAVCAGQSTTLAVQNTTTGAGVTYQWQTSSTLAGTYTDIATATSATYTFAPTTTAFYRLRVTCASTAGVGFSNPVQVTVNPLPVVAVTPQNACGPVALTATGADTYTWTPAAGLSATTGATVNANPTATTVYTVTGTITATGCQSTATTTVRTAPSATFTALTGGVT